MAKNPFDFMNQEDQQQQQQQPNQFSQWMQQANTPNMGMDFSQWRGTDQTQQNNTVGAAVQPSNYGGTVQGANKPINVMDYMPDAGTNPGVSGNNLLGGWSGSTSNAPLGFNLGNYLTGNNALDLGKYTDDNWRQAWKSMAENTLFPYAQLAANLQGQQFDQYTTLKNLEETLQNNQFNRGQTQFENALNTRLADDAMNQFMQQMGLDSRVAEQRYGDQGIERYNIDQTTARNQASLQNQIDLQNLINSGALGQIQEQGTQDTALQRLRGQQEMAQLQEQLANQLMQSRYNAFGRAQGPNVRQPANWG